MLKSSTVVRHPAADTIDRAIAAGLPLAAIARRHGLTPWAVGRRRDALRLHCPEYLRALAALAN